ncbi:MAG: thiamine diphosphokinase [Ignavibacteriales bacterium]
MNKCIIIANGKAPGKSLFPFLKKKGFGTIICADGGANSARQISLKPDYIIGDLDSIHPETLEYYKNQCIIKRIKRQDDTDVEKCLKFAIGKGFRECVLLGVIGDRLDHSLSNLGIALRFTKEIPLRIISDRSYLTIHSKRISIKTVPGEVISIYAFDMKTRIRSIGLKYELNNIPLPFGQKESTSNVAVGDEVSFDVKSGSIFIIREFSIIRKYDLF